jgi:hypothetical protein
MAIVTINSNLSAPTTRTPRVLMIFDQLDTVDGYAEGLREAGFEVMLDMDFEHALVTTAIGLPDIIVVDVRVQRSNCARFLQRTFNDVRSRSIPVVIIADGCDAALPGQHARALSLYPRWEAPRCLGSHLRRWFFTPGARHASASRSLSVSPNAARSL